MGPTSSFQELAPQFEDLYTHDQIVIVIIYDNHKRNTFDSFVLSLKLLSLHMSWQTFNLLLLFLSVE